MRAVTRFFAMSIISAVLSLLGCSGDSANGQSIDPPPKVGKRVISFEEQLETFRKLGFQLNAGTSISDIDRWGGKNDFEGEPFKLLYITLGQTIEREPWTPLTDRVWDFDTEAIEDHGAYVEIMKNFERITRGEIKFVNLKDYVDVENKKAWVSFSIGGRSYKWNLKVDDDWADPELSSKVVELTRTLKTKGKFTYFNTGGQDAVIGFETPESRDSIIKATGLKIEWLD